MSNWLTKTQNIKFCGSLKEGKIIICKYRNCEYAVCCWVSMLLKPQYVQCLYAGMWEWVCCSNLNMFNVCMPECESEYAAQTSICLTFALWEWVYMLVKPPVFEMHYNGVWQSIQCSMNILNLIKLNWQKLLIYILWKHKILRRRLKF